MPSERIQRRIDKLLDEAETAADNGHWDETLASAEAVLEADATNEDARVLIAMARGRMGVAWEARGDEASGEQPTSPPLPSAFVSGRYQGD